MIYGDRPSFFLVSKWNIHSFFSTTSLFGKKKYGLDKSLLLLANCCGWYSSSWNQKKVNWCYKWRWNNLMLFMLFGTSHVRACVYFISAYWTWISLGWNFSRQVIFLRWIFLKERGDLNSNNSLVFHKRLKEKMWFFSPVNYLITFYWSKTSPHVLGP